MANAKRKTNNAERNADNNTTAEDEQKPVRRMNAQLASYRPGYVPSISCNGSTSLSNGDKLAKALEGFDLERLLIEASGIFGVDLRQKYERLNNGQKRMNTGNRLRAALKNEDSKYHADVVSWLKTLA